MRKTLATCTGIIAAPGATYCQNPAGCHATTCATTGSAPTRFSTATSATASIAASPISTGTIAKDIGRQAVGGLLRRIPIFGGAVADSVTGEDPRYIISLTPQQLDKAWEQVKQYFRECPTCLQTLCLSDLDEQSGFCQDDSPRAAEIAEAQAEQAAGMVKGIANVFGLGGAIKQATEAAQRASAMTARCPQGWHAGRGRHQVLPGVRHGDDPAHGGPLPQVRHGCQGRQVLPRVRHQDRAGRPAGEVPDLRRGHQGRQVLPRVRHKNRLKCASIG